MATIKFLLKSKKNPATIYVRVREGRAIDVYSPTKFFINPSKWSISKGQPHKKNEALKNLNTDLENLRANIVTRLNQRKASDVVNTKWVKDIITPPQLTEEKTLPGNIIQYFDLYIEGLKAKIKTGEITEGTVSKYKVIKNLLEGMQDETEVPILIRNINLDFKAQFDRHCLKYKYAPNTIGRAIKFVKTVCRDARTNGLETHPQLDLLKGKTHRTNHINLTFDELEAIDQAELSDYLNNARDWLIISCYTGQRVSDFMRFTKDMIRTENKKQLIEFTQVKTGKIMTVPLHKKVIEILDKRNGDFPRSISDQRYNDYIKEVCKLAGLTNKIKGSRNNPETNRKEIGIFEKWELVCSHIGRRSFSSNFYGTVPTALLISATGHSTEKMFLTYIGKTDTQKAMQLADYF